MSRYKKYKILISIVLCFVVSAGCDQFKEDYNKPVYKNPVKIGIVGDVSASRETVENIFFGVKLAAEEINARGGIEVNGEEFEIELVYANSAGLPDEGIAVTNQLIDQGIDIIIGPTFSSVAIEMAELCIKNDVLMMTYAATTPELSFLNDKNLIWRTCPSDYTFGAISAQYCFDTLKMKKAAILYGDDRFGKGLSGAIKNTFIELGGSVVNSISFPVNEMDLSLYNFSDELNAIFSQQVDVVYIIAFPQDLLHILNGIYNNTLYQSLDKKPVLFVNDGTVINDLLYNVNQDLLNTIMGITSTNSDNPNFILYQTNYDNRFGFMPNTFSEHAYDALYCLSYAMLRANSFDPSDIANYLKEVSGDRSATGQELQIVINVNEYDIAKKIILGGNRINYEGASGPINFDYNGDPKPVVTIWRFENNEFVELSLYD